MEFDYHVYKNLQECFYMRFYMGFIPVYWLANRCPYRS